MEIISPHNIKPIKCKKIDFERIYTDSAEMLKMCFKRKGLMGGAFAIAHTQVTDKNPLMFFVTKEGRIICNPKIISHTKTPVESKEHCLTFFYKEEPAIVKRFNVIEVEYDELINEKLEHKKNRLSGKESRIWQHEIQHLSSDPYIYAVDFNKIMKEKEADKK